MADSSFRVLATEVNAKLTEILTLEGRAVPEYEFALRKQFREQDTPVRIAWVHDGGFFSFETKPAEQGENTPITPPLGTRVAIARIYMWHVGDEPLEHMLDRFWMATRQISSGTVFRWKDARYEYPTELVGEDLKNGVHVVRLTLPCEIAVSGDTDAQEEVTVEAHDWRAGIESPAGEPEDESEYDVIRTAWTG